MKKIFISSTSIDLQPHRTKVEETILELRDSHPVDMKHFTPDGSTPLQMCYNKVRECDILIGFYAHRYGWQPGQDDTLSDEDRTVIKLDPKTQQKVQVTIGRDDHTSITHYEFLWARELGLTCICFTIFPDHPWIPDHIDEGDLKAQLNALKTDVEKLHKRGFNTPDDLARKVATAISHLLGE